MLLFDGFLIFVRMKGRLQNLGVNQSVELKISNRYRRILISPKALIYRADSERLKVGLSPGGQTASCSSSCLPLIYYSNITCESVFEGLPQAKWSYRTGDRDPHGRLVLAGGVGHLCRGPRTGDQGYSGV